MNHSKSYLALNQMIEKSWLATSISDFEQALQKLEENGDITGSEHHLLLLRFIGKDVEQERSDENRGERSPIH